MKKKEVVFIDPLHFVYTTDVIKGRNAVYYYVLENGRAIQLGPNAEMLYTAIRTQDKPIKFAITIEYEPYNFESYVEALAKALYNLTA